MGGGNSDSNNSSSTTLDFNSLLTDFISATGGGGDFDGAAGQQCVDVSQWFIQTRTTLNHSAGHAKDVVANSVAANPSVEGLLSSEPRSPGVFSAKECGIFNATLLEGVCYGHTGLVIDVKDNGDGSKTVTTMEGWNRASPIGQRFEHRWTPGMAVDFMYLGNVLK
jgi:hypothetical protein